MDRPDEPRTPDLFEQTFASIHPPIIPKPVIDTGELLSEHDIPQSAVRRALIQSGLSAAGFSRFLNRLNSEKLEALLRVSNLRLPGSLSPALSTTAALLDDQRQLSPFQRAATLIFGAYSLYQSICSNELMPDLYHGQPGEMGLYPNLFSTCMIASGRSPALFKGVFEAQLTLIIYGRFFLIRLGDLRDETWVESLAAALEKLADEVVPLSPAEMSPGLLTAASTETQLKIFNRLAKDPIDAPILRRMRRSLITVCLDLEQTPESLVEAARLAQSSNFPNRWFHSSCQIIVFGNSRACTIMNYQAHLDGHVMMRSAAEIQQRAAVYPLHPDSPVSSDYEYTIYELDWDIIPKAVPPELYRRVQYEITGMLDPQPATFTLESFGQDYFDRLKLDPGAVFSFCIQAALIRLSIKYSRIMQVINLSAFRCMNEIAIQINAGNTRQFVEELARFDTAQFDPSHFKEYLLAALDNYTSTIDKSQNRIPFEVISQLYLLSRKSGGQFLARAGMQLAFLAINSSRTVNTHPIPDVLIYNPPLYEQAPVVGRPGVRTPAAKLLVIYYQIWKERIVLTMTAGEKWKIPNQLFIDELSMCLEAFSRLAVG